MSYGIRLHVWGDLACFTRPELKVERVSYDVMPPSAARGILEAIHWKPAIKWWIDRIHVLKPIRFQTMRRNEVTRKIPESAVRSAMRAGRPDHLFLNTADPLNRAQRSTMLLRDVSYVIEAHFELTKRASADDSAAKHFNMFCRRATSGQCYHQPCLGNREFIANFALLTPGHSLPSSELGDTDLNRRLGRMVYDINFADSAAPRSISARLENGVLEVARLAAESAFD